MSLDYEGWCRRIDLGFRSKFPYLTTRIYKISPTKFLLKVDQDIDNKEDVTNKFEMEVRFVTAPVHLTWEAPDKFEREIEGIGDNEVPSNFEGVPFSVIQMLDHLACTFPLLQVSSIKEDFERKIIVVTLKGTPTLDQVQMLEAKLKLLKSVFQFKISTGGESEPRNGAMGEVFQIGSASSAKALNCEFLRRDEQLWFENVESIYKGKYTKSELYFFDPKKTSCIANFSKFKNCNLRSLILLYDVVYCILPLREDMNDFIKEQSLSRTDLLHLISRDRIKILNLQPESRLEYGFINEAFQENENAVVSRRALAALCAIDLVSINKSYILSDQAMDEFIYPLINEMAVATGKDISHVADYLLWPKRALRSSFIALNEAGPMGAARYGVNNPIINGLSIENKERLEFEFIVNSDQIHLAHALDATYFPFYVEDKKYTDHPFALAMGSALNFYKNSTYSALGDLNALNIKKEQGNPTIDLISIFQVNDFISIEEYEKEVSSAVIRKGMGSLFAELSPLSMEERALRIAQYNKDLELVLSREMKAKHALDLGVDTAGCFIPFLSTILKYGGIAKDKIVEKMPVARQVAELVQSKLTPEDSSKRNISVLSEVNRVAKLKVVK